MLFISAFALVDPLPKMGDPSGSLESLTIERVQVTDHGFDVKIRADGPEPLVLAQVMVDGAYWVFSQNPPGPIARMDTAWIEIDFPWVADEVHHLRLLTAAGTTFEHTVDVALKTPRPSVALFIDYALLGLFVALVPVAFGMLFFPFVKLLPPRGLEFVLTLTIGLLGYLFIEMTGEGLELSARASAGFGGPALVVIPMALTLVALLSLSSRSRTPSSGLKLAAFIALGIGLHNFGEGLAIGASFAVNEMALGAFLIIGFTLHNATEGIGVVSPLVKEKVTLPVLIGLALLAGIPAVPGIWVGAFVFSPHWAAVFFGIGAGAVLQVMVEIDRFIATGVRAEGHRSRFTGTSVAGYGAGAAIMYGTALLITV